MDEVLTSGSMVPLNLPDFSFKLRSVGQRKEIFDGLRRKYVALTPEEWVRQHFIHFLVSRKKYPASYITVERGVKVNAIQKRTDIVVFNRERKPWLLVECKGPAIEITEETLYQAGCYNLEHRVTYLVLTNGLSHLCFRIEKNQLIFEESLPDFPE